MDPIEKVTEIEDISNIFQRSLHAQKQMSQISTYLRDIEFNLRFFEPVVNISFANIEQTSELLDHVRKDLKQLDNYQTETEQCLNALAVQIQHYEDQGFDSMIAEMEYLRFDEDKHQAIVKELRAKVEAVVVKADLEENNYFAMQEEIASLKNKILAQKERLRLKAEQENYARLERERWEREKKLQNEREKQAQLKLEQEKQKFEQERQARLEKEKHEEEMLKLEQEKQRKLKELEFQKNSQRSEKRVSFHQAKNSRTPSPQEPPKKTPPAKTPAKKVPQAKMATPAKKSPVKKSILKKNDKRRKVLLNKTMETDEDEDSFWGD